MTATAIFGIPFFRKNESKNFLQDLIAMRSAGAESLTFDTSGEERSAVLSKAVGRAAEYLGLTNKLVAETLGLSEASVSRLRTGGYVLRPGKKEFELAQLLVRLFRSIDAMTGGDDAASQSWLMTNNVVLGARPIDLIVKAQGLVRVLAYMDARRAPV